MAIKRFFIFLLFWGIFLGSSTACTAENAEEAVLTLLNEPAHPAVTQAPPATEKPLDLLVTTPPVDSTEDENIPLIPEPIRYQTKLAFVGDLMCHDKQLENAYQKETDTYTFTSFEAVAPYIKDADFSIGNLETTLSGKERGFSGYPTFNTPDSFAEAIKEAGFDLLTTANNHCNDKGEKGILRTLETLDALGLEHIGTYASQALQEQVFIKEINHIRFAFLAYTYSTNGIPLTKGKPYLANMLEESLMRQQITQARLQGAEVVIVLPHMGNEYEEKPVSQFTRLARSLCAWGADAVMASHPHVLQPTEILDVTDEDGTVRTCFIAYSMGNFVSSQRTVPRDAGAVFNLYYEKTIEPDGEKVRLVQAEMLPTWVKYTSTKGERDIQVLPVYDQLQKSEAGEPVDLRPADITRLREVHRETTRKMLGYEVPFGEMQPTYELYSIRTE